MEKLNIFLFRVICVYFYFINDFYLGDFPFDIPLTPYNMEYLLIIVGALIPFVYYFRKGKIKNKILIVYEIIFMYLFFGYVGWVYKPFHYITEKAFFLSNSYCFVIWLLLSYYDFEKKE